MSLLIFFQNSSGKLRELMSTNSQCFHSQVIQKCPVIGVLYNKWSVRCCFSDLFHCRKPVFLKLVWRPAANHFHPMSFRCSFCLFAKHFERPRKRRNSIPSYIIVVVPFIQYM